MKVQPNKDAHLSCFTCLLVLWDIPNRTRFLDEHTHLCPLATIASNIDSGFVYKGVLEVAPGAPTCAGRVSVHLEWPGPFVSRSLSAKSPPAPNSLGSTWDGEKGSPRLLQSQTVLRGPWWEEGVQVGASQVVGGVRVQGSRVS